MYVNGLHSTKGLPVKTIFLPWNKDFEEIFFDHLPILVV
jgi:hypothetical protein